MNPVCFDPDPRYRFPVNQQAARVLRPGVKYEPCKRITNADQDLPFPLRATIPSFLRKNPSWTNLTGVRFGRMIVCGLADVESKEIRWSCRCACGRYALRSGKAICNPANSKDSCELCRHLTFLRREDNYRQTGRDQDDQ